MNNKQNTQTVGEIWDIMPNKFQGVVMGVLLFLLAMASSELLELLIADIFIIDFLMAIIYIVGIFKVMRIIYPWLSSN